MSHHEGECPVCKKAFKPDDDVVICPICGAPYHRECYVKEGQCVFTEKHKSGFEYKPPRSAASAYGAAGASGAGEPRQHSGVLCKNCSTVNDARNIFCEQCGAALHPGGNPGGSFGGGAYGGQNANGAGGPFGGQNGSGAPFGGQGPGRQQNPGGPYGGYGSTNPYMQVDLSGELDGIPKQDWAAFIGTSAPIYIARMVQQDERKSKISAIFTAFFFPGCFFAYRKVWGWALVALLLWLLIQVPGVLAMLVDAGSLSIPGLTLELLATLSQVARYVNIARMLAFGLFGLFLYRRDAAKKIRAIRQSGDGSALYQAALQRKGAPTILGPVGVIAIIMLLSWFVTWLGGEALYAYALGLTGLAG